MSDQKKNGTDIPPNTESTESSLLPVEGIDLPEEDDEMNPIRELLLEFLARRKRTLEEPPPITAADLQEFTRILTDPTDEERAEGLRALERYRERQHKTAEESNEDS